MSTGPGEPSLAISLTNKSKKWPWASEMWELLSCPKDKLEFIFFFFRALAYAKNSFEIWCFKIPPSES